MIVDPSRTFQTINGWEAVVAEGWTYSAAQRDALVEDAVNDFGLTRLRLGAQAQIEGNGVPGKRLGVATNDNPDPAVTDQAGFDWTTLDQRVGDWVIPFKRAVETRGEPFVLNVTYVGFTPTSAFHKNPSEYAEFVSAILHRLRDRWGIEPELWDISNEPDNPVRKSGFELGRMMKAAGDRARAEGFRTVMFIAPSVTDADNAISTMRGIANVPGVAAYWAEASYHLYRRGGTTANRNVIRDFARAAGLRTAMTEFIGATAEMLHDDLTEANVSSWEQYTLAFPRADNGGHYYVPDGGGFVLGRKSWYLRQYFRYIRPGAVRVEASSRDESIHPVAFRNPGGDVVVVANTDGGVRLAIAGLPAGTYQVTYTTGSKRGASGPPVTIRAGEILAAEMPSNGTITLAP